MCEDQKKIYNIAWLILKICYYAPFIAQFPFRTKCFVFALSAIKRRRALLRFLESLFIREVVHSHMNMQYQTLGALVKKLNQIFFCVYWRIVAFCLGKIDYSSNWSGSRVANTYRGNSQLASCRTSWIFPSMFNQFFITLATNCKLHAQSLDFETSTPHFRWQQISTRTVLDI